ncbi:SRPBCC family protein [Pseudomaricurvus sp. HS19]|uniref:aromatic ring-hydroxylating oxygenase subunit alpha n=1 Tax=Pseudomaricurvus sp. HS19 TaxID=2692626 RepID=UPI001368A3AD|nr:aromatic ring-hydroxylating dioxygenase subunit alpha [Pseudomaricurvus sp. HS19]MYM64907.1 Rieske 2Fe-2S domain-containing protein [Pseudomaricurvus sp. HS19]
MQAAQPQGLIDDLRREKSVGMQEAGFDRSNLSVSTDRYVSREYAEREREMIWMKTWQAVGREDQIPNAGDWKEYRLFDQSFLVVRGSDQRVRGFVNACPHRGNVLCTEKHGSNARFTCPYHHWSFALDGKLVGVGRPDLVGPIDKSQHGLVQVSVDTFGGFIFLNPDPDAQPLREYLGEDVVQFLEPYHLEKLSPVMDVREALDCNWKVVVDAFQEGYHIDGIHPELLAVIVIDPSRTRYNFPSHHNLAVAPFDVKHANDPDFSANREVEAIRALPGTFPGVAAILPKFEELAAAYQDAQGEFTFPGGVSGRSLLQQATRETLTASGLDVSGLTDAQMSDNHGYLLFPNFFMTVRAGECHIILPTPHPDGDPNRCIWHVTSYMWLPPGLEEFRAELVEVTEPGTYPYFLALQQDYEQMPRQQNGLRNALLKELTLAQEEVCVAHFHSVVDKFMAGEA